jgi:hypothetical protein
MSTEQTPGTIVLRGLPRGCQITDRLYDDPTHRYELGDVLAITLPTGLTLDVGWDEDCPDEPLRIVVFKDYFGDKLVDFRVRKIMEVVTEVESLAWM